MLDARFSHLYFYQSFKQAAARSLCDSWASCYGSLCRYELSKKLYM